MQLSLTQIQIPQDTGSQKLCPNPRRDKTEKRGNPRKKRKRWTQRNEHTRTQTHTETHTHAHTGTHLSGDIKMGRDQKETFPNLLFLPDRCPTPLLSQKAFGVSTSHRGPGLPLFPLLQEGPHWIRVSLRSLHYSSSLSPKWTSSSSRAAAHLLSSTVPRTQHLLFQG